jgi:hypothetical protein
MRKLFKNIEYLATFDDQKRKLENAYILVAVSYTHLTLPTIA